VRTTTTGRFASHRRDVGAGQRAHASRPTLGLDAVKTYTSDPGRDAAGVKYGFLSLTVAVKLLESGRTDIESG